jgi:integrase
VAIVPRKTKAGVVYWVATSCPAYPGGPWFERVDHAPHDRREAERLDARRRKEVKAGTYRPPAARTGRLTVRAYAERWLAQRTNRSAGHDAYLIRVVLAGAPELAGMPLEDVRAHHVLAAVKGMPKTRAKTTIANAFTVLGSCFAAAVLQELIPASPFAAVPAGTFSRTVVKCVEPFEAHEVAALLDLPDARQRVFCALALWTGMRLGEICGRRWRDIQGSSPLDAIVVATQYQDQPIKGDDDQLDRPRRVPIHPELHAELKQWWHDWAVAYGRAPTLDDFILPRPRRIRLALDKKAGHRLFASACAAAGVPARGTHIARHTFITAARRTAPPDVVESITHNAAGSTAFESAIAGYTHTQWDQMCDAVAKCRFDATLDRRPQVSEIFGRAPDRNTGVGLAYSHTYTGSPADSNGYRNRPSPIDLAHLPGISNPAAVLDASQDCRAASDAAIAAYLRARADQLARALLCE